jgi:tetratricopeptide (TPR) repeat protein
MKPQKIHRRIVSITALLLVLSGCDSYLSENPDNRVELDTPEKAAQLLTNAYSSGSYTFTEWMSDNVAYTFGTQKLPEHVEGFSWEDFTRISQDTPSSYWVTSYEAVAHANEVLAVIDDLGGERSRRNAVKGEAYLARAYGHFMLVNLFAKHYDPATASSDLGIPYVDEPETEFFKTYERLTVQEVYDKVEEDLERGLDFVDGSYYANSGKYHFTRGAALAFASRFYLFKGDYDQCINYSSQLLGANPTIYVKDIPALLEQRVNTEDYIRLYHSPGDDSNLLLMRQVSNFHLPNLGHWPSRALYSAIFESNPYNLVDERQDPAWVAGENGLAATKYEFLFERTSLTSNVGFNYTIFLGFRGEEVLLNRAESYIQQNQLSNALADLQLLIDKRYRGTAVVTLGLLRLWYGTTDDQEAALLYLLDERQREFMHEGMRWFDIRRFDMPVTHVLDDGSEIELAAEDLRKQIQIPKTSVDVSGLEPNPR